MITTYQEYDIHVYEAIHHIGDYGSNCSASIIPNRIILFQCPHFTFEIFTNEVFLSNTHVLVADQEDSLRLLIERDKDKFQKLSSEVKNALKDENTLVYINHGAEGWKDIKFELIAEIMSISKEQIVWLTSLYPLHGKTFGSDSKTPMGKNSMFVNFWESKLKHSVINPRLNPDDNQHKFFKKQMDYCIEGKKRNKLCTSYARRRRAPRLLMAMLLKQNNLLKDMYWSLGLKVDGNEDISSATVQINSIVENITHTHPWILNKTTIQWLLSLEENVTCDIHTLDTNLAYGADVITWEHVYNTKFMLIHETMPSGMKSCRLPLTPFLSEKIYKPFLTGQLFVVHGCAGTVSALRQQGYNVFDNWIDHSYDTELDPINRATMIANEVKRLSEIPDEEWLCYLKDSVPECHENYKRFIGSHDMISTGLNITNMYEQKNMSTSITF